MAPLQQIASPFAWSACATSRRVRGGRALTSTSTTPAPTMSRSTRTVRGESVRSGRSSVPSRSLSTSLTGASYGARWPCCQIDAAAIAAVGVNRGRAARCLRYPAATVGVKDTVMSWCRWRGSVLGVSVVLATLLMALTDPASRRAEAQTEAPLVFAAIGDYGRPGPNAEAVAALVASWNPAFVITTGDNNYEAGAAATIDRHIGQYYHAWIAPYSGAYGP